MSLPICSYLITGETCNIVKEPPSRPKQLYQIIICPLSTQYPNSNKQNSIHPNSTTLFNLKMNSGPKVALLPCSAMQMETSILMMKQPMFSKDILPTKLPSLEFGVPKILIRLFSMIALSTYAM